MHVDSKQAYTLKRVCLNTQSEREQSARIVNERTPVLNLVTLLKKLTHPLIPKCHKLLKTTNNMYLIYDRLGDRSLEVFWKEEVKAMPAEGRMKALLKMA